MSGASPAALRFRAARDALLQRRGDPVAAARLLLAAADIQDYGAAGLRDRTGGGFRIK